VTHFAGPFDDLLLPSLRFVPTWPANRSDKLSKLQDFLFFSSELTRSHHVMPQVHQSPEPSQHGFVLQITIVRDGPLSDPAIHVHFPADFGLEIYDPACESS
jgi:hypothetical protein